MFALFPASCKANALRQQSLWWIVVPNLELLGHD
jgi:hypothetical protein